MLCITLSFICLIVGNIIQLAIACGSDYGYYDRYAAAQQHGYGIGGYLPVHNGAGWNNEYGRNWGRK